METKEIGFKLEAVKRDVEMLISDKWACSIFQVSLSYGATVKSNFILGLIPCI